MGCVNWMVMCWEDWYFGWLLRCLVCWFYFYVFVCGKSQCYLLMFSLNNFLDWVVKLILEYLSSGGGLFVYFGGLEYFWDVFLFIMVQCEVFVRVL